MQGLGLRDEGLGKTKKSFLKYLVNKLMSS